MRDLASKARVPQVIFTVPGVTAMGLTAGQAEAAGRYPTMSEFWLRRLEAYGVSAIPLLIVPK